MKRPNMRLAKARQTAKAVCSAALLLFGTALPSVAAEYHDNFTDVASSDWFYDSVAEAYSMGVIDGVSASSYSPNGSLDLASCLKLACCAYQLRTNGVVTLKNGEKNWYEPYVDYARRMGIFTDDFESYDIPASRALAAVIFAGVLDELDEKEEILNPGQAPYQDVTDPDLWYYSGIQKLYNYGIMTGDETGNFNPGGIIRRGEVAAVVVRLLNPDRRVRLDGSTNASGSDADNTDSAESAGEPWTMSLYSGGSDTIAFTGQTGFSLLYANGVCSGYSTECLNDVTMTQDSLSFVLRKNVGLNAMGIVRGWLNNAAESVNGVPAETSPEERTAVLASRVSLTINGRPAPLSSLTLQTVDGDARYTLRLANRYRQDTVTSVILVCGELPADFQAASASAIADAASLPDARDTTASESASVPNPAAYQAALNAIRTDAYTELFSYEADRMMILYGFTIDPETSDASYALRFVYKDGSTQTVAVGRLEEIRMNESGSVLYYTVLGADGSLVEYGVNVGAGKTDGATSDGATSAPSNQTGASDESTDSAGTTDGTTPDTADTSEKPDLHGVLAGLNITLSGKDRNTIALVEGGSGNDDILFRALFADRETAFSIVRFAPSRLSFYNHGYLSNPSLRGEDAVAGRIFALKDGDYFALIYENGATDRIKAAAERVISSVTAENAFDCVYTGGWSFDVSSLPLMVLLETGSDTIAADPCQWVEDESAPNGFRIDNPTETRVTYKITSSTPVHVLALDWTPTLTTTYGEFRRVWSIGSKWKWWRIEVDPSTNTVLRLIEQYVP